MRAQDVLRSRWCGLCLPSPCTGYRVCGPLARFLGLYFQRVQHPQIPSRLRELDIRSRKLERHHVQCILRRFDQYAHPFSHLVCPKLTIYEGAQGFIARESVTLGNLTVANQALGESLFILPRVRDVAYAAADGPADIPGARLSGCHKLCSAAFSWLSTAWSQWNLEARNPAYTMASAHLLQ